MPRLEMTFVCDEPWSEMQPEGAGRRCAKCNEVVVDLAGMTRKQALAVVQSGARCVSLLALADGTPHFRPEPLRAGALAGAAASLLAACGLPEVQAAAPDPLAGIAMPPPTTASPVVVTPAPVTALPAPPVVPQVDPDPSSEGCDPDAVDRGAPDHGAVRPAVHRLGGAIRIR